MGHDSDNNITATVPATPITAEPEARARAVEANGRAEAPVETSTRLVSLDAYRGFTMLAMVSGGLGTAALLGDPTWGWLADQLQHRLWVGCTAWDLIQPSFMFIVGVAMPFAFARRREQGESWSKQFGHVVQRCLLLIAIGVFLDAFGKDAWSFQLIRVLQQIAIGYFLAFLVLHAGPSVQALTAVAFLVIHTLAFHLYGHATGLDPWGETDNVGVWLDRTLHLPLSPGHYVTLNALSSASTILFGVLAGELLRAPGKRAVKAAVLAGAGLAALALGGLVLTNWAPMVKRIWTASFGVYAAGWTCLTMAAFYAVIDVIGWQRWSFPLVVVGMNSIAIYVVAGMLGGPLHKVGGLFVNDFIAAGPVRSIAVASLAVVFLWGFCYWLYRHRIFFKV